MSSQSGTAGHRNVQQAAELIADFAALPQTSPARTSIVRRLRTLPSAQSELALALQETARRPLVFEIARTDVEDCMDDTWIYKSERWMKLTRPSWQELAQFCTDTAWTARRTSNSAAAYLTVRQALSRIGAGDALRTRRYLYALALRYDFRCRALGDFFTAYATPPEDLDPFSRALHAFALLGQSNPAGLELIEPILHDARHHRKVAHVLLHGLWLGDSLPDQPRLILDLFTTPAFATGTDPIALYRKTQALRRLGRYHDALGAITDALEALPPSIDPAVHSDFVRERALTTTARDMTASRGTALQQAHAS
ncbi:hypothetical protein [Streptomyces sp. NPDC051572]|uniref:hypothetical protein n=1 Tax=Streptomyces sp. NPDC051572 TaxID=3155802 RepID=UPI00344F63F3